MMFGPRNARRQMGEDQIIPAIISDQPVSGGEIDANGPFLIADLAFHRRNLDRLERLQIVHAAINGVDSIHLAISSWATRSGWAEAKAGRALADSSARRRVG